MEMIGPPAAQSDCIDDPKLFFLRGILNIRYYFWWIFIGVVSMEAWNAQANSLHCTSELVEHDRYKKVWVYNVQYAWI